MFRLLSQHVNESSERCVDSEEADQGTDGTHTRQFWSHALSGDPRYVVQERCLGTSSSEVVHFYSLSVTPCHLAGNGMLRGLAASSRVPIGSGGHAELVQSAEHSGVRRVR
jgi:hypothetical protein